MPYSTAITATVSLLTIRDVNDDVMSLVLTVDNSLGPSGTYVIIYDSVHITDTLLYPA